MAGTPDTFYTWGNQEPLLASNLTKRFLDLSNRLKPLEGNAQTFDGVVAEVNQNVLASVEDVLANLRAKLAEIVALNWLTGISGTSITLVEGEDRSIVINLSDTQVFAPGPYSVIQRTSDPNTYAVVQTSAYDSATGTLDFHILSVVGDAGPFTDWSIAALAGSTLAQMVLLADGQAAETAAVAAAVQAAADRDAVAADKGTVAADMAATLQAKTDAQTARDAAAASATAAALFDPSNYYGKTTIDAKFTALIGAADSAGDTLGELEALIATKLAAVNTAADADVWAGSSTTKYLTPASLLAAMARQASSGSGSWAPDFNAGINFGRTATGASTLANPTNAKVGWSGDIRLVQDATGSRTWAFGTAWKFAGGAPTASTAANAVDHVSYEVITVSPLLIEASFSKAFA